MFVDGAFSIVSGAAVGGFTCETGIGCLAAAGILSYGADTAGHGIVALWTGEQQTTFGAQLLMKTGLSQAQAEILYGLGAAGVELATLKYLVKSPALLTDDLLRSYKAEGSFLPSKIKDLSVLHITNSGETVLGHFPGYINKANLKGASFFDIGDAWNDLTPVQRWAANTHFLDAIASKGDIVKLSLTKGEINPNSYLAKEIEYLTGQKGYKWVNQWSLRPPSGY